MSAIGDPPLESAPATCTELALSAAALVVVRISAGVLDVTPLPEDEPPQPAITTAMSVISAAASRGLMVRRSIAAQPNRQGGCRESTRAGYMLMTRFKV